MFSNDSDDTKKKPKQHALTADGLQINAEATRISAEQYKQIVETAYEGIWVTAPETRTTFVNKQMADIFGYTIEEMIGQPLSTFLPEKHRTMAYTNNWKEILTNNKQVQFEHIFRRKDGTELYAIVSMSSLLNDDGGYAGVLCMVTDITERKLIEQAWQKNNEKLGEVNKELIAVNAQLLATKEALKQQIKKLQESKNALVSANQRLQDIIEFFPDATLVIDSAQQVIAWNKAMEKMTGVPKETMLGKNNYAIPFYGKHHPILIDYVFGINEPAKLLYDSFKKEENYIHGTNFVP